LTIYLSIYCQEENTVIKTFLLSQKENFSGDSIYLVLKLTDPSNHLVSPYPSNYFILDMDNNLKYYPIVSNLDLSQNDKLLYRIKLVAKEPLRPFELYTSKINYNNNINYTITCLDKSYTIDYLSNANLYLQQNKRDFNWSTKIAESIMSTYPNPIDLDIYKSRDWNYTNGFMINAIFELYKKTKDQNYLDYVIKWYSYFINNQGKIDSTKYVINKYELDDILPGRSLIDIYRITGDKKFKLAADEIASQFKNQPRTHEGGFWHKKSYNWQMWLDGIYMADIFYLQYANTFNKPLMLTDAAKQFIYIKKHLNDSITGLYYHGWDESGKSIWANAKSGISPEFWGRGIGWYDMALIDGLNYLPEQNPYHDSLKTIFINLSKSLSQFQDSSGMWYQIVNKLNQPGNWPETSATLMFAYAYMKGYNYGLLNNSYHEKALKAFEGLKKKYLYFDVKGNIYLTGTVKVGTLNSKISDGSYNYYISVDRRINDFKGLATLLYFCIEMEYGNNSKNETKP
jgi:unsaturated rhamnogalacturonyl hydrolase